MNHKTRNTLKKRWITPKSALYSSMKVFPFNSKTTPWRVDVPAAFSADGKRKAKYFTTKAAAQDFCRKASKPGFTLAGFIPQSQQDSFSVATKELAKMFDGDVSKLYRAAERIKKHLNIKPANVSESLEAFQAWRETQVKKGILKASSVDADRWRLLKLDKAFGEIQLADLTTVQLREFFDEIPGNPRSIYKSIRVFFGWALERGYLGENPMLGIKPVGEFGINNDYYPVETFKRFLRIAAGLDPVRPRGEPTRAFIGLLPLFVVSGFLGLRSHEAFRLTRKADSIRWTDLHFELEVPSIEIRAEIGKTGLRYIETVHYLEAAKAWLQLAERETPHIVRWTKRQIQELKRDFKKATGLDFTENGFRNSFATYALTFNGLQGVGKLALEMGNSEAICKRHYVRTIAPGSGRAWFNLRPFEIRSFSESGKIISLAV